MQNVILCCSQTDVSSATLWTASRVLCWQISDNSAFPSYNLELFSEAQPILPFNQGMICTSRHTHTHKQQMPVRRGGGPEGSNFHSLHFPPSRTILGESGNKHPHYLQHVLAAS